MSFQIEPDQTIERFGSDFLLTCESGTQLPGGIAIGGRPGIPIINQSFDGGFDPQEGSDLAFRFAGTFSSDMEASGTFNLVRTAFRILEKGFTAQICSDLVEWTATWTGPAGSFNDDDFLKPSPGDQVITESDDESSVQIVLKRQPKKSR